MSIFISCLISNICSSSDKLLFTKPNLFINTQSENVSIKHSNTIGKDQPSTVSSTSNSHLKKIEPISPLMNIPNKNTKEINSTNHKTESKNSLDKPKSLVNEEYKQTEINKDNRIKSTNIKSSTSKVGSTAELNKKSSSIVSASDLVDMQTGPLEFQAKCFVKIPQGEEFYYYNLANIKQVRTNILGAKLSVNLCDYASVEPCNSRGDLGLIQDSDCVVYSENKSDTKTWVIEDNKFTLTMPEGRKCTGRGQNPDYYKVKVVIKCDEELKREPVIDSALDFDTCKPTIVMRSAHVCKNVKFKTWIEESNLSPGLVTFLLISLGLTILLFGNKLRKLYCIVIIALCSTVALFIFVEPVFDFPNYCKYFFKITFLTIKLHIIN
jgi:hypothetical protein